MHKEIHKRYIYGFHAILARVDKARESVHKVYVDAKYQQKLLKRSQAFLDHLRQKNIAFEFVDVKTLDAYAQSMQHQGVVAYVDDLPLCSSLDELLDDIQMQSAAAHILVLDEVTDPHNLGACLRVADAAGVDAILVPKHHSAQHNATVDKVSSGASASVPLIGVANINRAIEDMQGIGIWVFGTSDKATRGLYDATVDLKVPLAWVMGAEGRGMRHQVAQHCDDLLSIPMQGSVNSLNVSVASAVCVFEAVRQRSMYTAH